jgi:serine/threonine protein kinase
MASQDSGRKPGAGFSRIETLPDAATPSRFKTDDIVGSRYRLISFIGEGAMGEVFVAENVAIGVRVAIKFLKPELLARPQFRQRFEYEARAISAIQHPNVARFFDLVIGDPTFLVMEYVEGPNLADVIKREGRLQPTRAAFIATRLAWALDAVHTAGIIHRDLKPSNIVLTYDPEHFEAPKLIDFGLAKLAIAAQVTPITRAGQVVGTPHYMAPEQIAGEGIDARTDVYSLGCVLYEMVTGRPPYDGGADVQLMYKQIHEPVPPVTKYAPDTPHALERVIMRALAKRPEERFASARALAHALVPSVEKRRRASSGENTLEIRSVPPPLWQRAMLPLAMAIFASAVTALAFRSVPTGGLIMITSDPSGARVELDGRVLDEPTPTAVRGVSNGTHSVRIQKAGHEEIVRQVTLEKDGRRAIEVTLPPLQRELHVSTLPPGASVYVDGVLAPGKTPTVIRVTDDDFHDLRLERLGYEPLIRAVKPEDRNDLPTLTLAPSSRPQGLLQVDANAPCEVWIDGIYSGFNTPTVDILLHTGDHVVELRTPSGTRGASRTVHIQQGETLRLALTAPEDRK